MASLAQVPDFGQASDVPERDSTSWFRLAQLEVECAETKMRVRALRAELGVEKEATEDIDAVEEQGTLCVTQTALKEMRLRYEDQCAARREAERQNAALVKQLEAASRVRNALLEESAVQSDAQAAKAEATQTALKEMCLRYEDQRAARREAERKNAALVQQLEAASPARSALLEESGVQFDAQAAKAEATAAELMGTRAQLAESNKYLRAAAEEISSSKLALESMNAKFAESQTKFQELTGEVRMVRAAIVVAFDDADQAKAVGYDQAMLPRKCSSSYFPLNETRFLRKSPLYKWHSKSVWRNWHW
ncbi:hypothetical protein B0H14DRAFT_1029732 [Mycena olivaceomarginata]|nr:hypothetical protein B0H14DRAFT_1029732 [Mycena olivaceomarginata]